MHIAQEKTLCQNEVKEQIVDEEVIVGTFKQKEGDEAIPEMSSSSNPTRLHHNNVWFPTDVPWKPERSSESVYNTLFSVVQSTSGVSPSSTHFIWSKFINEQ